jgi:hypothetical protein
VKKTKQGIPYNTFRIIIQILNGMVMLYIVFLVILKYVVLPDTIPAQYNALDEVDGWGLNLPPCFSLGLIR